MIEYTTPTGTGGTLKVVDKTDNPAVMTVEFLIHFPNALSVPQLPWTYSIDGVMKPWKSVNFSGGPSWQPLGTAYAGGAETVTLHLGDTGTTELGGPTDQTVNLYGYSGGAQDALVRIRDGGVWKFAIPYVNDNGSWKKAVPYVKTPGGWKPTT